MGKRSDSESRKRHKTHKHRHRRREVLQNYVPRRKRISNFDRPPQPSEIQQILSKYETEQKLLSQDPVATKHARRVYVGNIAPQTSEQELRNYVSKVLVEYGGIIMPGDPVVTTLKFADFMFIELRTLEETEAALTLNGLLYDSKRLVFRRPADFYNRDLNFEVITPRVNLNKVGLESPFCDDEANKILIGGLCTSLHEEHVKEILCVFGTLKAFYLKKDEVELQSQGYAFCEYVSQVDAERCTLALNGTQLRGKTLVVRKVISNQYEQELIDTCQGIFRGEGPDFSLITQYPGGCIQPNFETIMYRNRPISVAEFIRTKQNIEILQFRAKELAQERAKIEKTLFGTSVGPPGLEYDHRSYEEVPGLGGIPCVTGNLFPSLNYLIHPEGSTNIVVVDGIVDIERFVVDKEFRRMYDEIMEEINKYGTVISLIIPRPSEGYYGNCIGRAYVEYNDVSSAVRACSLISQHAWKGNYVKAEFFDAVKFMRNELS